MAFREARVVQEPGRTDAGQTRHVTVVRRLDCRHGLHAVHAVQRLAGQLRILVRLEDIVIQTDHEARAHGCLGSPTVLVSGRDVEPSARGRTSFGVT
jgi:hypothetical protein